MYASPVFVPENNTGCRARPTTRLSASNQIMELPGQATGFQLDDRSRCDPRRPSGSRGRAGPQTIAGGNTCTRHSTLMRRACCNPNARRSCIQVARQITSRNAVSIFKFGNQSPNEQQSRSLKKCRSLPGCVLHCFCLSTREAAPSWKLRRTVVFFQLVRIQMMGFLIERTFKQNFLPAVGGRSLAIRRAPRAFRPPYHSGPRNPLDSLFHNSNIEPAREPRGGFRGVWGWRMNANTGASEDIATPPGSNGLFASLLPGPTLPALAARLGAKFAAWWRIRSASAIS